MCSLSEIVVKLKAVCVNCGKDAAFTERVTCETEVSIETFYLFNAFKYTWKFSSFLRAAHVTGIFSKAGVLVYQKEIVRPNELAMHASRRCDFFATFMCFDYTECRGESNTNIWVILLIYEKSTAMNSDGSLTVIFQQEVIGGKDKYQAVCRACYKCASKLYLPTSLPAVRFPLHDSNHDFPHVEETFQKGSELSLWTVQ